MRTISRLLLLAAVLTPILAAPPVAAAPVTAGVPAVLPAGQRLTANSTGQGPGHELDSPDGVFTLRVTGMSVEIDEDETLADGSQAGTVTWWQFRYPGGIVAGDKSTLRMQDNGNLVLYTAAGKRIWASGTTGAGNSLHMQDNGSLVIDSGAGKAVWSSGTTRTILAAGDTLASGAQLVNRYRQQFGVVPTYLVMQPTGNLAVRWRGKVRWSTRTSVRGSRAVLTPAGRLAVVGPGGTVRWQSAAFGQGVSLSVNQCGQISLQNATRTWYSGPSRPC